MKPNYASAVSIAIYKMLWALNHFKWENLKVGVVYPEVWLVPFWLIKYTVLYVIISLDMYIFFEEEEEEGNPLPPRYYWNNWNFTEKQRRELRNKGRRRRETKGERKIYVDIYIIYPYSCMSGCNHNTKRVSRWDSIFTVSKLQNET